MHVAQNRKLIKMNNIAHTHIIYIYIYIYIQRRYANIELVRSHMVTQEKTVKKTCIRARS